MRYIAMKCAFTTHIRRKRCCIWQKNVWTLNFIPLSHEIMSLWAVFRAYGRHKILRYREYFPRKKCYNWQKNIRKLNCLQKQFSLQYFWSTIMNNDSIKQLQLALSCQLHVLKDINSSYTHLKSCYYKHIYFQSCNNFRVQEPITNGMWKEIIYAANINLTTS